MRRGTIFVILFIVLAAAVIGASQFLQAQPPREITIAVTPLAEDWVRAAAQAYNSTNPLVNGARRIRVNVIVRDDVALWGQTRQLSDAERPDGWLSALPNSFELVRSGGASITPLASNLAITPLIWGGFRGPVNTITADGALLLDWPAVRDGIAAVRPAFPHPAQTTAGFGVLASGAAHFNRSVLLTGADFGPDYRAWIEPIIQAVANYNTLGADVAETMASRGPSVGGVALLPESQWLTNLRGRFTEEATRLVLMQPEFPFIFSFGYALWERDVPPADEADRAAAVRAFGSYLAGPEAGALAARFGLRPADGSVPAVSPFTDAAAYGAIAPIDTRSAVVLSASAGDIQRILAWAQNAVR
jgi:hypothetical protein